MAKITITTPEENKHKWQFPCLAKDSCNYEGLLTKSGNGFYFFTHKNIMRDLQTSTYTRDQIENSFTPLPKGSKFVFEQ